MTTSSTTTPAPTSLLPKSFAVVLFLLAPLAVLVALAHVAGTHYLPLVALRPVSLAVLALFSPSPISLPALVMQDVRDAYDPAARGLGTLRRGVAITFWLVSQASPVRAEMIASLVGFAAGLAFLVA